MLASLFHNRIGKVCALAAATLILPALAFAQNQNGQGGNNNNPGGNPPRAPEANAALVLIPVLGAVLFFSTRRFFGAKTENGR